MYRAKAFTLIELLITIAIISILTGVASISYSGLQARGRDSKRKNDLQQIKVGLSLYNAAQSPTQYPASSTTNGSCNTVSSPPCTVITVNGTNDLLTTALKPNYMPNVPTDPRNATPHVYKYQENNVETGRRKDFVLYGTYENKNSKEGWGGGTAWVEDGYRVYSE